MVKQSKDFTVTIELKKTAHEVFKALTNDVPKWWGGKDLKGNTTKLNDEFVIHHKGAHYSKQRVVEIIPDKKVVWLVTESELSWLKKNKDEWTNTKIVFEITNQADTTQLCFTHEGLSAERECYEKCANEGWNIVINEWLFEFVAEGKPHF